MTKTGDSIRFESRGEISDVINFIDHALEQNPKEKQNKTIKRLYDLLDVMEMEW